jgi:spermidine synthase
MARSDRAADVGAAGPRRRSVVLDVGGRASATAPLSTVAPLLFFSGLCALVYQIAWLREMRLVFGASTAASAAVLAIFMGGLGVGGLLLGSRADRHPRPLGLYASLEVAIALTAALTPGLSWIVREAYIAVGGSAVLGTAGATVVRLVLAAVVLAPPTLLMGGTLPAAARAVAVAGDTGRRRVAVLYGANTLGAVAGALLTTFVLLEAWGTRGALWVACLVNLLVAIVARSRARGLGLRDAAPHRTAATVAGGAASRLALAAAAIAGFAFFLMELVWYRMLGPLLGGSLFTFGLILGTALAGVGLGGFLYALRRSGRPATYGALAFTCVLEAACLAAPWVLGDRIAALALLLRPLGALGFGGLVLGWSVVAAVVVLPAAIVAGVQFPLLIALLGRGGEAVGRHVAWAAAWNTAGAIAGSLAGGFGAMPLLGAEGTWCAAVALLLGLGIVAAIVALRHEAPAAAPRLSFSLAVATAALMATATGPTAAWRHSPIGAGRAFADAEGSPNALQDWMATRRRAITWTADGVESSVALDVSDGFAFVVNGKIDGSARGDAGTQVMLGLVPAILHGTPKTALVVGLGTGSSAGWLGAISGIERVDVVELEPAVVEIARLSAAVNRDVLANPKVRLTIGDAREVLFTTPERYDVIASEPSNPYRAGVASLFTREFYEAAAARLRPGGLFAQWVQAYEIDGATLRTAYATLGSVFPHVETWRTGYDDLLLVASAAPIPHDAGVLRRRIAEEPYRTALANAWRADELEAFYARYVAGPRVARTLAEEGAPLNTDDHTAIEFGFARSIGRRHAFVPEQLRAVARARGDHQPTLVAGTVDWTAVARRDVADLASLGVPPTARPDATADERRHVEAFRRWVTGDLAGVRAHGDALATDSALEALVRAEAFAAAGDAQALEATARLRAGHPIEATALEARLAAAQGRFADAATMLADVFARLREDPWPLPLLVRRTLALAADVGLASPADAPRLFAALGTPFALDVARSDRLTARLRLLPVLDFAAACADAIAPFEPHPPWDRDFLALRLRCYDTTRHPLAARAEDDLGAFLEREPPALARNVAGT